ncbi:MAG: sigma-70 family RNA polymerase sigma factor [Planctomycetes bacterium]|nr:sigma-70 family RNA polymerase sigma factor [Planctomycetota bacterium]
MKTARVEDANLVQQTLAGDQRAFQTLVERYQGRLFAVVRHYTRNAVELEDIVQETFLKAYRRLDSFDHRSSFYTWIYRIATNTVLDFLKRRGRSPVQAVEDPELVGEAGARDCPAPMANLEARELAEITQSVLAELPDIFRTVLVMREFDQMAYQEIADTLEISIGTVESRLFRARARFKDKLLKLYPEFGAQ